MDASKSGSLSQLLVGAREDLFPNELSNCEINIAKSLAIMQFILRRDFYYIELNLATLFACS